MVSLHNSVFFVYLDITLDERVFYVGKGLLHRVQLRERRNVHWKHIAVKHGWRREVVLATKDEKFAFDEEKRLIREHKTFYGAPDYAWGANKTEGGEGATGYKHPLEMIEYFRQCSTGRKHTSEAREKNRIAATGVPRSSETKAKLSAATSGEKHYMYGRSLSPEARAQRAGEMNGRNVLTAEQVDAIRKEYALGGISYAKLGAKYGVTGSTACHIVKFRIWKLSPSASPTS